MVTLKPRGQVIFQTEGVSLRATFRDLLGNPADLDAFPTVSIVNPANNVIFSPSAAGVYRVDVGTYGRDFFVGNNEALPVGVWADLWMGQRDGLMFSFEGNFIVANTDLPSISSDGYLHLGDDPGYSYSQTAISNINILLKLLKTRLKSNGKRVTKDQFGNDIYSDCNIYSIPQLIDFLVWSLGEFNIVPFTTWFSFDDTNFIRQYASILVDGAFLMASASQALIERGREYAIQDSGISVTIPNISELLNSQWSTLLTNHTERLRFIKNSSFRPLPLATNVFNLSGSSSSVVEALRWRKQGRVL